MKNHNKRNLMIISGVAAMMIVILLLQVSFTKAVIRKKKPIPIPRKELEVAVEIVKEQPAKAAKMNQAKPKPVKPAQIAAKPKPVEPVKSSVKPVKTADTKGSLPPVSANYRKYVGFKRYSEEMVGRGAKFLIFGGSAKRLFEIDIRRQTLVKTDISKLVNGNYSSRSRVIVDEPALSDYLKIAKERHGITDPEVHLLVPREFESRIAKGLQEQNIALSKVSGLKGFYAYSEQGKLTLRLNQALTDRGVVRLDFTVEL